MTELPLLKSVSVPMKGNGYTLKKTPFQKRAKSSALVHLISPSSEKEFSLKGNKKLLPFQNGLEV